MQTCAYTSRDEKSMPESHILIKAFLQSSPTSFIGDPVSLFFLLVRKDAGRHTGRPLQNSAGDDGLGYFHTETGKPKYPRNDTSGSG